MTTCSTPYSFALLILVSACGAGSDDTADQPVDTDAARPPSAGGSLGTGGSLGKAGAAGAKTPDGGAGGAGGARNTGGSQGLGGAPRFDAAPPVVRPCSNLPSSGLWEKVTPPGDVGDSQAVRVHPTQSGTIYVNMHKGGNGFHFPTDGLYKSTDCGATWSDLISVGKNSDKVNNGSWWAFEIDPRNDQVIYAIDGYGVGGFFKSVNGGVDWEQMLPPAQADQIPSIFLSLMMMDLSDPYHLVAATHVNCTGPTGPGCLVETMDAGLTWQVIKSPSNGWIEGAGPIVLGPDHLLFTDGGLNLSLDHGKTWANKTGSGAPSVYKAPDGRYFVPSNNGIYMSQDGMEWSKVQSKTQPRLTQVAGGKTHLYASDQWTLTYMVAPLDDPAALAPLEATGLPANLTGTFSLQYDDGHNILYSSHFDGGLWRLVTK